MFGTNLLDRRSRTERVADQARRRSTAAMHALAGRRPRLSWPWLVGAGILGAAVGLAAGTATRRAAAVEGVRPGGRHIEFVDVDQPGTPVRP